MAGYRMKVHGQRVSFQLQSRSTNVLSYSFYRLSHLLDNILLNNFKARWLSWDDFTVKLSAPLFILGIHIYIYITWCCKVIITCAHKMTAVHSTFNSVLSFTAYPNDGASYSPNSPSTCASASYHLVNAIVKRLKKKIIAKPYSSSMTAKSDLVNRFISAHTHHTNFVKQLRCLTGKARDLLDHILILLQ